jgi:tRNA U38,U39,U40 pseudouridine synthase TruA
MYLGVIARPRENFDFDGRVYLECVSKKKVITKETPHTQFTDDVIMNADLRQNGWRRLVPDGSTIKVADLIDSIVEEYDIDEEFAERHEFSYKTFEKMRETLSFLVGRHDFQFLQLDVEKVYNFERQIHSAE